MTRTRYETKRSLGGPEEPAGETTPAPRSARPGPRDVEPASTRGAGPASTRGTEPMSTRGADSTSARGSEGRTTRTTTGPVSSRMEELAQLYRKIADMQSELADTEIRLDKALGE